MTALLDAIGKTILSTKKRIKKMKSIHKPKNVILVIITDGFENASVHFNRQEIFKMIKKRKEKDNWQFVFIGANQDAIKEASYIGINKDCALDFEASNEGINMAMCSLSSSMASMNKSENKKFKFD